jgi:2-oxo-4-hydroxy-4-carboxy-5-ureidoimidazoline decarboxylase
MEWAGENRAQGLKIVPMNSSKRKLAYRSPTMTITEFNVLSRKQKKEMLRKCCGATTWVDKVLINLPVRNFSELLTVAEEKWWECSHKDWLEAFQQHPKIGDLSSIKEKYANTVAWASNEQSAVSEATDEILQALEKGNRDYEQKFGFIFIVCASGKSAGEMLEILQKRLSNSPRQEINIAAEEQLKITKLRLEKLFS